MKLMTTHGSSAETREATPHVNLTTRTATNMNALKRRAQVVLNDKSIDPQSRAIIRYALEISLNYFERDPPPVTPLYRTSGHTAMLDPVRSPSA
jgi:hypothetical protein